MDWQRALTIRKRQRVEYDIQNEDLIARGSERDWTCEDGEEREEPSRDARDTEPDVSHLQRQYLGGVEPADRQHAKGEAKEEGDQHHHAGPTCRHCADGNGYSEARHTVEGQRLVLGQSLSDGGGEIGAYPIVQITVPIMSVGRRPQRSMVSMPQVVKNAQATWMMDATMMDLNGVNLRSIPNRIFV